MHPILVVDDEADFVANYQRLLRRRGYRVVSAGSRGEGLG
jgi:CheY-like chemotaxis protein